MPTETWKRIADLMAEFPKEVAWREGVILTGLNFKAKDGGWFLVVSAKQTGGERVVSYHWAWSIGECLTLFWDAINRKGGVKWYPDKYAK